MLCKFSRDERIRTSDLQHPMLARYRATLHPVSLTLSVTYCKPKSKNQYHLMVYCFTLINSPVVTMAYIGRQI